MKPIQALANPHYNSERYLADLQALVAKNPRLVEDEKVLLEYYKSLKSTWSNSAFVALKSATGLTLRSRYNRAVFAQIAARSEIERIESSSGNLHPQVAGGGGANLLQQLPQEMLEIEIGANIIDFETKKQLAVAKKTIANLEEKLSAANEQLSNNCQVLRQKETELSEFKNLNLMILMLPPGPPLNGTENCPAMRVLGSPTSLLQLKHNYRQLIAKEHPDVSKYDSDLAADRYLYVRQLYQYYLQHWDKLKPTRPISNKHYQALMNATTDYPPDSFWP